MKFNYKTCSPAHSRFSTNARFLSCCGKLDSGWMEKRRAGSFEAFMLSWNKLFKNSAVLLSGASMFETCRSWQNLSSLVEKWNPTTKRRLCGFQVNATHCFSRPWLCWRTPLRALGSLAHHITIFFWGWEVVSIIPRSSERLQCCFLFS